MDYLIEVYWNDGAVTFGGNCDDKGNVHVNWGSDKLKTIGFRLWAPEGYGWTGIQIARTEKELAAAPPATDTGGRRYGETCFSVGPLTTDQDRPLLPVTDESLLLSNAVWLYRLGIRDAEGQDHWADPKIENPGGDSTPPGLYHAGGATWVAGRIA